jgi:flagellar basal-body rod modification protein FlgD
MDAVTATTTTTAAVTSAATEAPSSSDFETYIQMLTVQLSNQDPMDPMEADDFAVQLATFSMVEQQTYGNALLETVVGQLGESSLAQMSSWVGMEARSASPVSFSGTPVELHMPYAIVGNVQELVITDAEGNEVDRIPVLAEGETITWDGTDAEGQPVEPGVYAFRVDSFEGEELVGSGPVESYVMVTEVRMTEDGVRLIAPGDVEIDPNLVSALRDPNEAAAAMP